MSKHLVLDVVALADAGKTREEIAAELGVTVESVSRRLRYAKRTNQLTTMPPRKKRTVRVVATTEVSGDS